MLNLESEVKKPGTIVENGQLLDSSQNQGMKTLNISVIHKDTQRPVSNALISIESIGKTAICNSEGQICLSDLKPGEYLVDIISPGYVAKTVTVSVSIEKSAEYKVKMESNC